MRLIDSHCHINFQAYAKDQAAVIKRAQEQGIKMLCVGSQLSTSQRAVEIAKNYPGQVYAAVGLHPIHLIDQVYTEIIDGEKIEFRTRAETFAYAKYKDLAAQTEVVALGETGFDFFHCDKKAVTMKQMETLDLHIKLAQELSKPLIFHCREAYAELLDFLKQYSGLQGVVHCYGGNLEQAQEFIKLGLYIGFTGIITFKKKTEELQNIAKQLPLERILIETDCPYLAPEPHRGERNEPLYVSYVAQKIAELKNISAAEVEKQTLENTQRLFNIA